MGNQSVKKLLLLLALGYHCVAMRVQIDLKISVRLQHNNEWQNCKSRHDFN